MKTQPMPVTIIHTTNTSTPEPPLDQAWTPLDKLRWHAGVVEARVGCDLGIRITENPTGTFGISVGNLNGCWNSGINPLTYDEAWTHLIAVQDGAGAAFLAVQPAIVSLRDVLAFSGRDWGNGRDLAWLWGIIHGWDDDSPEYSAMDEQARTHGWDDSEVARLRHLHGLFRQIGKQQ